MFREVFNETVCEACVAAHAVFMHGRQNEICQQADGRPAFSLFDCTRAHRLVFFTVICIDFIDGKKRYVMA